MESFEKKIELKSMPCGMTDKSIKELQAEDWECFFSFHHNIKEQWNMACEKAESAKITDLWKIVLVDGQNEEEKKDGIQYLYRRRIEK